MAARRCSAPSARAGKRALVPGVDPARVLLEMDRRKVFGLIIDPSTLRSMRVERVRAIGSRTYSSSYTEPEAMHTELQDARRLFRRQGWKVIDISGRAMEENASRIIDLYETDPPS